MPFKTIGLSDPLVQGILATGYTAPHRNPIPGPFRPH